MKPAALITGASGGIGLELARLFAREGYRLIISARSEAGLHELARSLPGTEVRVIPADLSRPGAAARLWEEAAATGWPVERLVNNAGFGTLGPFADMDTEKIDAMMELNMRTLTLLTRFALDSMRARGRGRILNVASTAAFQPGPYMAVYFATKAYVLHLSEALATELKGTGITVTALCPGPTQSGFWKSADAETSCLAQSGRLPTAEAVAWYGYRAMERGEAVTVHGWINRTGVFFTRLTPRALVRQIVARLSRAAR